jgi:hypothetical protein
MRCSVVWGRDCLARPAAGAAAAASKFFAGAQGMHYSACCACLHNSANQQRAARSPALIDAAFARAADASVQIYTKRTQERKKEKTSQKNIEKWRQKKRHSAHPQLPVVRLHGGINQQRAQDAPARIGATFAPADAAGVHVYTKTPIKTISIRPRKSTHPQLPVVRLHGSIDQQCAGRAPASIDSTFAGADAAGADARLLHRAGVARAVDQQIARFHRKDGRVQVDHL